MSIFSVLYLQACSILPVMTQPKVNNLPNLASAPKSPQGVSTVAMSQAKVDLIIYSGRSDPNWLLTQVETAELQRLISHLSTTEPVKDELYQLGYRGFFVNLSDLKSHQPKLFKIFKGIIEIEGNGKSQFFTDTNREVEHWLFKTGKSHLWHHRAKTGKSYVKRFSST
jgi:hypothetical protein